MSFADAQKAFRASPGRSTALAYMDAAIAAWWDVPGTISQILDADSDFKDQLQEIRDWLMNEREPLSR